MAASRRARWVMLLSPGTIIKVERVIRLRGRLRLPLARPFCIKYLE